ncbi:TcmI family type II polyketide cyclase, partial [Streptomyces olivaceoviridis]
MHQALIVARMAPGSATDIAKVFAECSSSVAPMPLMTRRPVRSCQARQVAVGRFSP